GGAFSAWGAFRACVYSARAPRVPPRRWVPAGLDGGEVDEPVGAAPVLADETEALVSVEPFHGPLCHCRSPLSGAGLRTQIRKPLAQRPHIAQPAGDPSAVCQRGRDKANHPSKNRSHPSKEPDGAADIASHAPG